KQAELSISLAEAEPAFFHCCSPPYPCGPGMSSRHTSWHKEVPKINLKNDTKYQFAYEFRGKMMITAASANYRSLEPSRLARPAASAGIRRPDIRSLI